MDDHYTVIFKNGTSVCVPAEELSDNETPEMKAKEYLKEAWKDGGVICESVGEWFDDEDDQIGIAYQSPELGCMTGVFNYYLVSYAWAHIDSDIVCRYRQKDIDEAEVECVVYIEKSCYNRQS